MISIIEKYRKQIRLLSILVLPLLLVHCEQATELGIEDVTTSGTVDSKTEESVSISMGPEQGTASLKIEANKAWSVSFVNGRADDWIKVYPNQGEGSGIVSLSVEENDTYEERSATLMIESEGLGRTIRITQKQNEAILVSSNRVEVGVEGENFTLEVRHNIEYFVKIDIDCASWISTPDTKSLVTDKVSFAVSRNTGIERREGKIRFVTSAGEEVVTVYQAGEEPSIVLSKAEYEVSDKGTVFSVDVASNVDVDYSISSDWITPITTKTMSTDKYTFEVKPNFELEARIGEISFYNRESGLQEIVRVYQVQKDAIILARSSYQIDNQGGNIVVAVGHNVDYTYEINAAWISRAGTKSYTTENLEFIIEANTGYDNREGKIIFTSADKSITQEVKVYQSQTDAVIVSAKEFNVSDAGETISFEIKSNIDFEVQNPEADWIWEVTTKGLSSYTKTYAVARNETYDSRTAEIVVLNKKTQSKDKVVVNQCQKDALIVSTKNFSFDVAGGNFEVILKSNIDYDYSVDVDWIKAVTTKGLEEYRHSFNVAAITDGTAERTGHLFFSNKSTGISDQVTVVQVNPIVLDKSKMNVLVGETGQITATVNLTDKTVIWESSDGNVARVDNSGMVTAVAKGQCTITAYTGDKKYFRQCEVIVDELASFVTARFVGGTYTKINETIINGSVLYYRIANESEVPVTVSSVQLIDGITGVEGNIIDAGEHILDGGSNWTISLTLGRNIGKPITVFRYIYKGTEHRAICNMDGIITDIPILSVSLSKSELSLEVGDSEVLTAKTLPSVSSNYDVAWSSGDESIAIVDNDGKVTGKSAGVTTIKAVVQDKEATCKVTVGAKSPIINFADAEVKSICVKNWDTNGDGELSEKEAAAVTDIGLCFNENNVIESFDEFEYFTGLKKIRSDGFADCSSLKSISLPKGITVIDIWAFRRCSSLRAINLPDGLNRIRISAFEGCSSLASIKLPETLSILEDGVFYGCSSLTSIKLPNGISSIGEWTFEGCSALSSVTLPEGIVSIGKNAFAGCSSLSSFILPDGVTSIESSTFSGCSSLTSISLPEGLTSIGYRAFYKCSSLAYIELPESVTTISDEAFYQCSICEIKMPQVVNSIGDRAFYECSSLESIRWPEGAQRIGDQSFYNCSSLESIILPEGITSIGAWAFFSCSSLSSINFVEGLTTIDAYAFSGCNSLVSISLPASIASVGYHAFAYCMNLKSITINATVPPSLGEDVFALSSCPIYVPSSSLDLYQSADVWSTLAKRILPIE